jgi:hypothetical protein
MTEGKIVFLCFLGIFIGGSIASYWVASLMTRIEPTKGDDDN